MLRLVGLAALLAAFATAGTASASAASTSCQASGTIKLSPGLSETAQLQNVSIKGTLTECASTESAVTSGKFVAHFKTAAPVTCATLTGAGTGAAEGSNVVIKWSPKGSGNSQGTFSVPITEVPGALVSGNIESGPFAGDSISGSISQSYTGGPTCGQPVGKKKAKKVNKGTFSGTVSVS